MTLADRFLSFAAATESPTYAAWARAAVVDPEMLALVERVPPAKQQPVLLFATARFLGSPDGPYGAFRDWSLAHGGLLIAELAERFTQTNDVRRSAPVALGLSLAAIDGPIALLEVGASAGLGLFPDRYDLRVGDRRLGDPSSRVRVSAVVDEGPQEPPAGPSARTPARPDSGSSAAGLPSIAARAGLDLAPVDVRDADAVRWLEMLVPPEAVERVDLLRAAVAVARVDPPRLLAGDAVDRLADLVALAPAGTTPVVVTSGTLVYLPGLRRQAFVDELGRLGARWVSYEKTGLLEGVAASAAVPADHHGPADQHSPADPHGPAALLGRPDGFATLAVDGIARAVGDAHGTRLRLL